MKTPIPDVIDRAGGLRAARVRLAEIRGEPLKYTTAWQWTRTGRIGRRWLPAFRTLAAQVGRPLTIEDERAIMGVAEEAA